MLFGLVEGYFVQAVMFLKVVQQYILITLEVCHVYNNLSAVCVVPVYWSVPLDFVRWKFRQEIMAAN
jgi:hypothetical protein